jgi:hypothetical protein
MTSLHQACITRLVERLVAGNDTDVGKPVIVTQELAQLVGTSHHHQVVMIKGPSREIHIPPPVILVVELKMVLIATAKHALRHHLCSMEQITD